MSVTGRAKTLALNLLGPTTAAVVLLAASPGA
jgi:hypothetical protein